MGTPARGKAALALLYDLPLLLSSAACRSAYLVEVRSNSRLLPVSTMRRAQQCRIRHAVCRQTNVSSAPHESKARLRVVTNRRGSWRSHVHRTYTAQRVQLFKRPTANVGGRGGLPSPFSGGSQRGYSLWKENTPFAPASPRQWDRTPPPLGTKKRIQLLLYE